MGFGRYFAQFGAITEINCAEFVKNRGGKAKSVYAPLCSLLSEVNIDSRAP
ncbi:MAG: hypothetical protein ACI97A_001810 [Planctomycetota bacterium]|jgi:hypothetical protein